MPNETEPRTEWTPLVRGGEGLSTQVPFSNIAALQLVRELVDGDETTFMSWELNLVLRDGSRLNVIDHAGGAQLREEATRLGQLIGCPIWEREAQPPSAAGA